MSTVYMQHSPYNCLLHKFPKLLHRHLQEEKPLRGIVQPDMKLPILDPTPTHTALYVTHKGTGRQEVPFLGDRTPNWQPHRWESTDTE